MKTITTALLTLMIALSSCDKCEDVRCLKGGECEDGKCLCPEPFGGPECNIHKYTIYSGYYEGRWDYVPNEIRTFWFRVGQTCCEDQAYTMNHYVEWIADGAFEITHEQTGVVGSGTVGDDGIEVTIHGSTFKGELIRE